MVLYVILIHHSSGLPMAAEVVSWAVVSWSAGEFCVFDVSARGCGVALFVVELSCQKITSKIMKAMHSFQYFWCFRIGFW